MPKRPVAEARRIFEEDVAPHANPYWHGEYTRILEAAEQRAVEMANERIDLLEGQVKELRDDALRTLTETRDEAEELNRELQLGHASASEYSTRLAGLRAQKEAAGNALARAEEIVDQVEEIEQDPIAFVDDLARRLPVAQQEFPW